MSPYRIGLIVPSSNVTVEAELPALLARHGSCEFSFHASRMRMHTVSADELRNMNSQRERCVDELADARVDALLYACLVAVMVQGPGEHRRVENAVATQLAQRAPGTEVLSSAGALVEGLRAVPARRIALVTPYPRPLAEQVVAYLCAEGFDVSAWSALEVADNTEVGRIPPDDVMAAASDLDLSRVDALVISACVQMRSLALVQAAEEEFGIPVLSAATAGAYSLLRRLRLPVDIAGAGSLLHDAPPGSAHPDTIGCYESRIVP